MAISNTPTYQTALQLAFEAEKDISRFKRLFDSIADKKMLNHSIIMAGQMLSSDQKAQSKLYKAAHKYLSIPVADPIDSTQKAARRAKILARKEAISGEKHRTPAPTFINLEIEVRHVAGVISQALAQMKQNKKGSIYLAHIGRAINNLLDKLKAIDNLHTRHDYISRAKNMINGHFEGDTLDIVKKYTTKLHDEVATRFKKRYYQTKVINRKKHTFSFSEADTLVKQAEDEIVLQIKRVRSWAKLAVCLSLVTGRRLYEICKIGNFTVEDSRTMTLTGVAKQKNSEDFINKTITFPTLINAHLIMQGIKALRDKKDFTNFPDYRTFNRSTNTTLRKALHDPEGSYQPILNVETQDIKLTPIMMRQIYAALSKYYLQKQFPRKTDTFYDQKLASILGHKADTDIQTVQSYKDFAVFDDLPQGDNSE